MCRLNFSSRSALIRAEMPSPNSVPCGTTTAARPRPAGAVEWVIYPEEGHGLVSLQARTDFWERVERFLGRHLAG